MHITLPTLYRHCNYRAIEPLRFHIKGRPMFMKSMDFREVLPFTLKNSVSGKQDRVTGAACTHELTMFLACLKRNDFTDSACTLDHATYLTCMESETKHRSEVKAQAKEGLLGTGGRRMTAAQLNNVMRQWPQPDVYTRKHNRPRLATQEYYDKNFHERYGHDRIMSSNTVDV